MSTFIYKGINKQGQSVSGTIEAGSINEVYNAVEKLEIFINNVEKADDSYEYKKASSSARGLKLLVKLTRQLANLLSAGIQLQDSLKIMLEQLDKPNEKEIIRNIILDLKSGKSFSEALSSFSMFQGIYLTMVSTGEKLGNLDLIMEKLADYYEKKMETRSKFISSLTYPMVVAGFALVVTTIMFTFIMPNLLSSFKGQEHKLPALTRFVMGIMDFVKAYWWLIGLIIAGIFYYFIKAARTPSMRKGLEKLIFSIPLVKKLYKKVIVSNFVWPFSLLIKNGVTIVDALEIIRSNTRIYHLKELLKDTLVNLKEGGTLHSNFVGSVLFDKDIVHMIAVGEKGEMLSKMLDKVIEINEKQIQTLLSRVVAMIEPLIIIFLGVVVGVVVFSIIMPITQMSSSIE